VFKIDKDRRGEYKMAINDNTAIATKTQSERDEIESPFVTDFPVTQLGKHKRLTEAQRKRIWHERRMAKISKFVTHSIIAFFVAATMFAVTLLTCMFIMAFIQPVSFSDFCFWFITIGLVSLLIVGGAGEYLRLKIYPEEGRF